MTCRDSTWRYWILTCLTQRIPAFATFACCTRNLPNRAAQRYDSSVTDTDNEEEAAEFMRNEPLIKHGLRRFELKIWEIREGTLSVRISAARSQGSLS